MHQIVEYFTGGRKMTFGQNLKKILAEKGISQTELAKKSGTSDSLISNYINNKRTPTSKSLNHIATALGVTADELLKGEVDKEVDEEVDEEVDKYVDTIYAKIGKSVIEILKSLSDEEKRLLIELLK